MSASDDNVRIGVHTEFTQSGGDNVAATYQKIGDSAKALNNSPPIKANIDSSATSSMASLGNAVNNLKDTMSKASDKWMQDGRTMSNAGRSLSLALTATLSGIGKASVSAFESFNSQMIQLKRVTQYTGDYAKFKDQIDQLSNSFGLSTNAAAGLMAETAALGMHGSDINKLATEVAKFSMVTQMDAQSSLTLYRQIMATFGGGSIDATSRIMAQLSAIVDDTTLSMKDLAQSLPQISALMKTMGFDAAGTAAALSAMSTQGIDASEGANSLKLVLMKLDDPTKKINSVIKDLGINFFDMSGKAEDGNKRLAASALQFTNLNAESQTKLMSELAPRQGPRILAMLKDMSQGVKELNQITADGVVTTKEAESVQSGWAKAMLASGQVSGYSVNSVDRFNKAAAEIRKDPGTGLKIMRAQFSQISRDLGDMIAPAMTIVAEKIASFLKIFNTLPRGVKIAVVSFGALLAAIGPITYALGQVKMAFGFLAKGASFILPKNLGMKDAEKLSPVDKIKLEATQKQTVATERLATAQEQANLSQTQSIKIIEEANVAASSDVKSKQEQIIALEEENTLIKENIILFSEQTAAISKQSAEMAGYSVKNNLTYNPVKGAHFKRTYHAEGEDIPTKGSIVSAESTAAEDAKIASLKAENKAYNVLYQSKLRSAGVSQGEAAGELEVAAAMDIEAESATTAAAATDGAIASTGIGIPVMLAIGATIAVVALAVKVLKDHWKEIRPSMQPGIDALKNGFNEVKNAFASVFSMFGKIMTGLGGVKGAASGTGSAFSVVGRMIGGVASIIGMFAQEFAKFINFMKPVFERFIYAIRDGILIFKNLINRDFAGAILAFAAYFYEAVRPVVIGAQAVVSNIAWMVSQAFQILANGASALSDIPLLGGFFKGTSKTLNNTANAIKDFAKDPGIVDSLDKTFRSGLGGAFGSGGPVDKSKPAAEKAGQQLGEVLGDNIASGAGGSGKSWVKEWVTSVYSELDKEKATIVKQASKAVEDANKAEQKAFDDKSKAIDKQIKNEERAYQTEQYIAKKKELLAQREVDKTNYKNERLKAIYEGRYDDARMLDIQQQQGTIDFNKSLTDLEIQRGKELVGINRDDLKEKISDEKQAASEAYDIRKASFDDALSLITSYSPATVGEFQTMLDQINALVQTNGGKWPEYSKDAVARMAEVFQKANDDALEKYRKSGEDAATAWMQGFATPETIAMLQAATGGGGGGGGGGGNGGDNAASDSNIPTDSSAADADKAAKDAKDKKDELNKKYKNAGAGAKNEAEQDKINIIKNQIATGNYVNQGTELYKKAMTQRQVDRLQTFAYFNDTDQKEAASYKNELVQMEGATYLFNQAKLSDIRKTSDTAEIFVDKEGTRWTEHNGKMVSQYGMTAEFIKDKNGNMTNTLIDNNGKIIEGNRKTFKTAQDLLDDMLSHNIKPGTVAAQDYVTKINELGYAVYTLPNGKTIVIDADTSKLKVQIDKINAFFKRNSQNGYVGLDIVDLIAQTGSVENAANYLDPLAWMNTVEANGKTWKENNIGQASGGMYDATSGTMQKFAGGGLVEHQKGGILAQIGEAGYNEFVISTDPKYRAASMAYVTAAAAQLGMNSKANNAVNAGYAGNMSIPSMPAGSSGGSGSSSNINICVETFIGEEKWFEEMATKYNMTVVPQERKIAGQQKRVVSSYNDRWSLK
jgi:TP901 family phage tail tape measure protein